jgi:predicted TIM-barrel fold metal-dependent hydrolase
MKSGAFYDAHSHALTLSHPCFLAFTQTLRSRGLEEVYAQMTAPNYLIAALFFKTGERMRNALSVMERDVGSIFQLMEDDLAGRFAREGEEPLLAGGRLTLGASSYERLVLCPLLMDFQCATFVPSEGTYYDTPSAKSVAVQIRDLLEGIRYYRRSRPGGFLEIRPFLGVDTRHYTMQGLAAFLDTAFAGYEKGEAASRRAFDAMREYDEAAPVPGRFAGIKVYPPLGFDPWPEGGREREKVELLWSFCELRDIPVVTHCDDQGFRVVPLEEDWRYCSPARWEPLLRFHPRLRLDFAHFGARYFQPIGRPASTEWTDRIVRLMVDYPNVYADFSFNGTDPAYYEWLEAYLGNLSEGLAALVEERLLFGSDFVANLTKIRSYSDYFRIFARARLPEELKARFGSVNVESFLYGENGRPSA